jgi:hypothetical protein
MPIQPGELVFMKSETVVDTGTNGGRMSATSIASGVKNNVFPDVTQAQRQTGLTRWRKLFAKVANQDSLALLNARLHLTAPTNGDDRVTLAAGTQRDRQADLSSPREYGVGRLKTNVAAGASSFVALLEDPTQQIFQAGDTVWVGDAVNSEYFANVSVAKSGSEVTITLYTGDQLANAYTSATGFAASVCLAGDVAGSVASWTETTDAGAYNEIAHPLEVDSIGGVEDDWLLTFIGAQNFTVAGAFTGALLAGTISQDYAPANAQAARPFFTLRAAGWSGAWASGDTLSFTTHPAAAPVWLKQIVPAGAQACNADVFEIGVAGESA